MGCATDWPVVPIDACVDPDRRPRPQTRVSPTPDQRSCVSSREPADEIKRLVASLDALVQLGTGGRCTQIYADFELATEVSPKRSSADLSGETKRRRRIEVQRIEDCFNDLPKSLSARSSTSIGFRSARVISMRRARWHDPGVGGAGAEDATDGSPGRISGHWRGFRRSAPCSVSGGRPAPPRPGSRRPRSISTVDGWVRDGMTEPRAAALAQPVLQIARRRTSPSAARSREIADRPGVFDSGYPGPARCQRREPAVASLHLMSGRSPGHLATQKVKIVRFFWVVRRRGARNAAAVMTASGSSRCVGGPDEKRRAQSARSAQPVRRARASGLAPALPFRLPPDRAKHGEARTPASSGTGSSNHRRRTS